MSALQPISGGKRTHCGHIATAVFDPGADLAAASANPRPIQSPHRRGRATIAERLFPPGRNELPPHRHDEKPGVTPYDHVDRIGRADVVARPKVARRLGEPV